MKTFTLNGEQIPVKEITYNVVCDMEDMGVSLADIQNKSMSFVRAYVGVCLGARSRDEAGEAIGKHIENGGDFTEIMNAMSEAVEESGFFRALKENKGATTRKGAKSPKA